MTIRLWVPGTIPPGLIERAVEAAWPGAHTRHRPRQPAAAARRAGGRRDAAAGPPRDPAAEDRPRPERRCGRWPAPAAGLADGEHAIVQVLARPVTGARLRRARRAARQLRAGQPARLTSRLLDVATPGGHSGTGAAGPPPAPTPNWPPRSAGQRSKSAGPQWETQIRYATATTAVPAAAGPAGGRHRAATAQARARLRGLAHGLASATALYAGRNWLARRRLRHPAAAIAARRFAPRRPAVGARAGRDRPPARRPGAARPGPRRGPRRRRRRPPSPCPARQSGRWGSPTPGRPARSAWRSPTPATTCGSSAPPGPARPP